MTLSLFEYILIFIVSFLGELYGSIVGGGGFLIQPFLIALGLSPHVVVASDVIACGGTSLGSFLVFRARKLIDWKFVKTTILSFLFGVIFGLFLLYHVSADFIEKFIAIAAFLFVVFGFFSTKPVNDFRRNYIKYLKLKQMIFGFTLGAYGSFSGAGATTFGTYFMTVFFGYTFLEALASQTVLFLIGMPLMIAGYIYLGMFELNLVLLMSIAMTLAGICGANLAIRIGNVWLKRIFSTAVLCFAFYLLIK